MKVRCSSCICWLLMNFLVSAFWSQLLCIRVQVIRSSIESRDLKRRKLVLKKNMNESANLTPSGRCRGQYCWWMAGWIQSMAQKNITSDDVAKLAKVSQSAVSRTFTHGASVSEMTRSKVLAAAKKLRYRPNAIARTLVTRQSRVIYWVFYLAGKTGNPRQRSDNVKTRDYVPGRMLM